ncbi:MAG: hypothetical protein KatS3mg038_3873 [Candidatus Kapaibacterium sp.]|nr:MAG: hypothetical protein KatS3mg038_0413 [Candidatus Kapabacteria bacterium]GIV50777.1 MAG: hypothetical protein KatS3mg038_1298 [Candidatus Kapabacteria bacterium]GIV51198.1 MAG: hypothetical protein KatS3mg038_1719 [Candidatus Kapabacteria bacterium]GIV51458.1 MAG: hypothetical protein KatS3mg038_1979 [Candidatus Kapabacteria bacterium]GIV51530.1 MAG: hypothetical protein KatS3mg038_2051 [Candidatus Kapabacteria bacterium]
MAAEMTNGVAMDWIGAIAKESLTGAILCLVLFAFFRYLRRADEDFRAEMRQRLSELSRLVLTMKTILVLHDMTVTGVNPSTDVRSNDPEVVRIAIERAKRIVDLLEELRDGLAAK